VTLLDEVREDLKTAPMQRLTLQDDPRGPTYGKKFLPDGASFPCAWTEVSTRERFEAGLQQRTRMIRAFVDLVNRTSPVNEKEQVEIAGRRYDVTSVKTIVSPGDEGTIIEAASV
jgi:hypothetical protein